MGIAKVVEDYNAKYAISDEDEDDSRRRLEEEDEDSEYNEYNKEASDDSKPPPLVIDTDEFFDKLKICLIDKAKLGDLSKEMIMKFPKGLLRWIYYIEM